MLRDVWQHIKGMPENELWGLLLHRRIELPPNQEADLTRDVSADVPCVGGQQQGLEGGVLETEGHGGLYLLRAYDSEEEEEGGEMGTSTAEEEKHVAASPSDESAPCSSLTEPLQGTQGKDKATKNGNVLHLCIQSAEASAITGIERHGEVEGDGHLRMDLVVEWAVSLFGKRAETVLAKVRDEDLPMMHPSRPYI